jgi:hypothetical protein
MVFSATFNNISDISWWSVLLVKETRVPGGNHQSATSHWQTLSRYNLSKIVYVYNIYYCNLPRIIQSFGYFFM